MRKTEHDALVDKEDDLENCLHRSSLRLAEVGVSHIHASHKHVPSLNLQVSSKSQVTVMEIKQVKLSHCYGQTSHKKFV